MLINSSEIASSCFVETKNLDGETNLKFKSSSEDLVSMADTKTDKDVLENMIGVEIHCDEHPTEALENFGGKIYKDNKTFAIGVNQILLRGCFLRNTDWIYGVALFTGH